MTAIGGKADIGPIERRLTAWGDRHAPNSVHDIPGVIRNLYGQTLEFIAALDGLGYKIADSLYGFVLGCFEVHKLPAPSSSETKSLSTHRIWKK